MITDAPRLHALDAVRGFALLLGVAFHAALSFMPGWPPGLWAMVDSSPSAALSDAAFVTHVFRMSLFFFIAGYFARQLHQKLGTAGFWKNRALRIGLPLVAGWVVLYPLISVIWVAGLRQQLGDTLPALPRMPAEPGAFPLTHLWFLYQLLMLYGLALVARALLVRRDPGQALRAATDRLWSFSLRWPLAVFLLGLPLALTLNAQSDWFYWTGIPTPDHSLVPQAPATVGFGTAFLVGWLTHRSPDALAQLARRWALHLLLAVVATGWLLRTLHQIPVSQPGSLKLGFAVVFGIAVWGWVLGLTGAALRFLADYSPLRRYLADASYWIYLAHLPLVAALQVWVGSWSWHWSLKYPFILVVSFALLFASYHWLVRRTFIGVLLNGRRHPRGARSSPPTRAPAPAPVPDRAAVAVMRGISKRFGKQTALADVDLELHRGELLAVLGPNGAGKSTAISLWLGLIEADQGEITLLGGSPQDVARRQGLGVMLQNTEMPKELTPRELVRLAASYYAQPLAIEDALRQANALSFADTAYGKLSGGQKRLAQFATAICGQPRVLFLDEPSVGLDIQAREALWASIRRLLQTGCSIVLTTHYLEEAEALADRVTVIHRGRVIASGTVDDMRARVARRQISCHSQLPVEEVRTWPGVVDAQYDGERLQLTVTDAEGVVRRLLAADLTVSGLEVRQAGLTAAFNELTREAA